MRVLAILLLASSLAWGAGVTAVTATTSTANTTSYASSAFTPAANDLLIVFVQASGTVSKGGMTDSQSLGFTQVSISRNTASANSSYLYVANALAANSSMTVTFNCTDDAATGAIISILRIDTITRVGLAAIRQTATTLNTAIGTPAPAFTVAALTGNVVAGFIANATNPAAMTEPSGWTEASDVGYATPTTGSETAYQASGFTGTTVTWGSSSATAFGSIIVELDTSSATGLYPDAESFVSGILTGTSLTGTHVTGSCSNRALFVLLGIVDNSATRDLVTGVTYNGTAMKYLGRAQDFGGSELFNSIWVQVAPSSGSHSITVSFGADVSISSSVPVMAAVSFCGVHQTYPYKLPKTASSGLTNATAFTNTLSEISTTDGDYIIGSSITHSVNITTNGAQLVLSQLSGFDTGGGQGFGASIRRADIGTSLTWTQGTSDVWSSNAIAVRPATATPAIPTLDQAAKTGAATAASSASIASFTASGCTNGILFYGASYKVTGGGAANISSISWDSLALIKKDEQRTTVSGDIWAVEIWYLKNPPSATSSLVATLSTSIGNFVHGADVWCLVDQTAPFGTVAKASDTSGTSNHPTVTVTSQTAAIVHDVLVTKGDPQPNTVQTGSKMWGLENATSPGDTAGAGQAKIGSSSVTMDYNITAGGGTSEWGIMGVGLNFGSSSGPPPGQFARQQ